MNRKERLAKVFEFLLQSGKAHTQKDLAAKMKATESNVSRAMKGDTKVLTDSFCRRLARAYDNVFSDEWLISGEGEMVTADNTPAATMGDVVAMMKEKIAIMEELLRAKDETIAAMQREQQQNNRLVETLQEQVADLRMMLMLQEGKRATDDTLSPSAAAERKATKRQTAKP